MHRPGQRISLLLTRRPWLRDPLGATLRAFPGPDQLRSGHSLFQDAVLGYTEAADCGGPEAWSYALTCQETLAPGGCKA